MNLLEIVLAFFFLLYAFILYRALGSIDSLQEKHNSLVDTHRDSFKELLNQIDSLRQKHNSLVDGQKDIFNNLLDEVNKQLETSESKHKEENRRFLEEITGLKRFLSQLMVRK